MTTMNGQGGDEIMIQMSSAELRQIILQDSLTSEQIGSSEILPDHQIDTDLAGQGQFSMNPAVPSIMQINHPSHVLQNPTSMPTGQSRTPYVEIVEQPRARGLRFRYECEGRSAGSIPGERTTIEKKTFPTVKIHNHSGPAIVVVSCVTKDQRPRPHPHALVGRDCKKGVCTVKVDSNLVSFPQLGIQCAKKKDVNSALEMRKQINVDPYQTGFEFTRTAIDLNVVCLCFQVFLPDSRGKFTRIITPVHSQMIHDKKALNDLIIVRVDRTSGRARGGDEVFVLCEKVNKDDIAVRFYEPGPAGDVIWEAMGDFGQLDVHKQVAIVFKTPAYYTLQISTPAEVRMVLHRPSDQESSEPITFTYIADDPETSYFPAVLCYLWINRPDPHQIQEKRKRKMPMPPNMESNSVSMPISKAQINEQLKAKIRKIKPEFDAGPSANSDYVTAETHSMSHHNPQPISPQLPNRYSQQQSHHHQPVVTHFQEKVQAVQQLKLFLAQDFSSATDMNVTQPVPHHMITADISSQQPVIPSQSAPFDPTENFEAFEAFLADHQSFGALMNEEYASDVAAVECATSQVGQNAEDPAAQLDYVKLHQDLNTLNS